MNASKVFFSYPVIASVARQSQLVAQSSAGDCRATLAMTSKILIIFYLRKRLKTHILQ
jgi:hypothetical protein